jgi:hypothetical protein
MQIFHKAESHNEPWQRESYEGSFNANRKPTFCLRRFIP